MHSRIVWWIAWGEFLWSFGWIVVMALSHTSYGNEQYQNVITSMFFHFVHTTIAVAGAFYMYSSHESKGAVFKAIHWSFLWVFVPFMAMDTNNVVRSNFLPNVTSLWYGTIAVASAALFLSTSTFLWYWTVLMQHVTKETESKPPNNSRLKKTHV